MPHDIAPRRAVLAQSMSVHLSDALGPAIIDKVAAGGFLANFSITARQARLAATTAEAEQARQ